jgi:hypothetical protein
MAVRYGSVVARISWDILESMLNEIKAFAYAYDWSIQINTNLGNLDINISFIGNGIEYWLKYWLSHDLVSTKTLWLKCCQYLDRIQLNHFFNEEGDERFISV